MFKFVTRMFRKKHTEVETPYELPSDDPELNPILVEEHDEIPAEEVVMLNSRLLAPVNPNDPANMSARSRAVVEIKTGLNDLGQHIRMLGQRLHAQSMGQAKLIEALSNLPATLKDVLPNAEEQNRALGALKLAMDEQTEANRTFVEALKPLPQFVQAAANLPETARKQMWAINELTKQLEEGNTAAKDQAEQVKVMVETLALGNESKTTEIKAAVEEMGKFQKAQLKQASLALKSSELARRSQRRHQTEVARTQQSRMNAMAREQARHFNRIEEHFKRTSRTQFALTGVAVMMAVAAITFAVLMVSGAIHLPGQSAQPTADTQERTVDPDAVVSR
ncbi:MAG: hypothetical protein H6839_14295 [Planctomycetes bacterium]|nr:hypothetical protein [Planctomycetota bacterium]